MAKPYKWKVDPAPTGKFKAFVKRYWPSADYEDGSPCAYITCEGDENYHPSKVREGTHGLLTVHVLDYSAPDGNCPWTRKQLVDKFKTVADAKKAFDLFVAAYPQVLKTNVTEEK